MRTRRTFQPIYCTSCDDEVPTRRAALGYLTCLTCGDKQAAQARKAWTVVPAGSKQGYTRVTRKADLIGIYKGSTIR